MNSRAVISIFAGLVLLAAAVDANAATASDMLQQAAGYVEDGNYAQAEEIYTQTDRF